MGSIATRKNKKDVGEAKNFSREYPVPDNEFRNTLDFVVGRNFMQCFSEDEMKQMHFDDTLSKRGKLGLLLTLLREKLSSQDAAAAPQTLYYVNYAAWDKLLLGIYTGQILLGHVEEAEKTIRTIVDQRKDKTNLSNLHSLSFLLEQQGKYAEAEDTEVSVIRWLHEQLGKDSPARVGVKEDHSPGYVETDAIERGRGEGVVRGSDVFDHWDGCRKICCV
jgi:hypothetical protein